MDDASPTEQLAYPSDRTILLQILHSITTIEQLVARILDVTEYALTSRSRQDVLISEQRRRSDQAASSREHGHVCQTALKP
jgi:hypothetical protein